MSATTAYVEPSRGVARAARWVVLERSGWMLAGLGATFGLPSLTLVSALSLVLGLRIYWTHGGHQITAAGLYAFATAIFVGYAGLWWASEPGVLPPGLFLSAATGYWCLLGMSFLWRPAAFPTLRLGPGAEGVTAWGATAGAGISVVLLLWLVTSGTTSTVAILVVLGSLALLASCLVLHRSRRNRSLRRLWLAALVVVVFTRYAFTGYGRLNLVALGFVALVLASALATRRVLKAMTIGAVGPALVVFSVMREQFLQATYGASGEGASSVVTPLRDFGALVHTGSAGGFGFGHGDSLVATVLFWVPRAWWPGKPIGLGAELTQILRPDLVSINQSLAALNQGEWYYNFGWLGVLAMIPAMGLVVRWLDVALVRVLSRPLTDRRGLVLLVLVVVLVTEVPNLMWVGSFGYTSRAGLRVVPLLLLLPFAWRRTPSGGVAVGDVELVAAEPGQRRAGEGPLQPARHARR